MAYSHFTLMPVKKNLKVLIPTLLIVMTAQFLLVRFYMNRTNEQTQKIAGDIDTSLPYPSSDYDAQEVLQVVMYALRNNDLPRKDAGITAAWQFFTPRLKQQLRDKALIRPYLTEDLWKAVIDFDSYRVTHTKADEEQTSFEVEVLSSKRLARQFVLAVHKKDNVWLIDQMVKRL